jgi:hypothetical protein
VVGSAGSGIFLFFWGGVLWYGSPPWWGNLAGISGALIVAVGDFCFLEGVAFFWAGLEFFSGPLEPGQSRDLDPRQRFNPFL